MIDSCFQLRKLMLPPISNTIISQLGNTFESRAKARRTAKNRSWTETEMTFFKAKQLLTHRPFSALKTIHWTQAWWLRESMGTPPDPACLRRAHAQGGSSSQGPRLRGVHLRWCGEGRGMWDLPAGAFVGGSWWFTCENQEWIYLSI